jgi:hypothetical protein
MGSYYPNNCNTVPPYNCDPCEPQELGRIRNAGFISKDKKETGFTDFTDDTQWADGIENGEIFLLPETHGDLPEPSAKMGPGFGNTVETLLAYDFNAKIFTKNLKANHAFWSQIKNSQNFYFFYSTSSQTWVSTNTVTIIPGVAVPDDLTGLVNWQIQVKWQSADLPAPFNTPDIVTECYDPTVVSEG